MQVTCHVKKGLKMPEERLFDKKPPLAPTTPVKGSAVAEYLASRPERSQKSPYFKFTQGRSSVNDSYCISLSESESVFGYEKPGHPARDIVMRIVEEEKPDTHAAPTPKRYLSKRNVKINIAKLVQPRKTETTPKFVGAKTISLSLNQMSHKRHISLNNKQIRSIYSPNKGVPAKMAMAFRPSQVFGTVARNLLNSNSLSCQKYSDVSKTVQVRKSKALNLDLDS